MVNRAFLAADDHFLRFRPRLGFHHADKCVNLRDRFRYITGVAAVAVVAVAFASAVVTGDFQDIQKEFGMGLEVVTLSVSLMVCGFG